MKPCGLWSRPLPLSDIGIRPNSPPQITSVLLEQPAALQVGQQAGDRLVGPAAHRGVVGLDVVVGVPAADVARVELDEPDAALDQPPRQQAARAELGGARGRRARRAASSPSVSRARSTASGAALCIR